MPLNRRIFLTAAALATLGAGFWWSRGPNGAQRAAEIYATPLSPPDGPLNVYHLGHSLVGRDMPAMLSQLVEGHQYASQLGWGTPLQAHWDPDVAINGFDEENAHDRFRPAMAALETGAFDALVLTEMVEIKDAVAYFDSANMVANWADKARAGNAQTRVYLYETWHHTDDPAGWLARIDGDLDAYWLGRILHPALRHTDAPIHLIPAGQVMAAFMRRVAQEGGIGGITQVSDLFATQADGTPDTIHFNDIGAYLVALTHYAVLYHRSPQGLPYELVRADGTAAKAPTAQAAQVMQDVVWQVVQAMPQTGVRV